MSNKAGIEIRQLNKEDASLIEAGTLSEYWGEDNEMTQYSIEGLRDFFSNPVNVMFAAVDNKTLACIAIAYVQTHPSKDNSELYVHEIDTRPDYRQRGLAKRVMKHLFQFAKDNSLASVWLTTEEDNVPANKLYQSLESVKLESTKTYSFSIKGSRPVR